MSKARLQIVFLDVNGTAIDDWIAIHAAVCAVFEQYGKTPPTIEEYARVIGTAGDYKEWYEMHDIVATREELYAHWSPGYAAHEHTIRVVAGLPQFIAALKERNVELHVLSSARRDVIEHLVERAGLGSGICEAHHYHVHDKAAQVRAVVHGSGFAQNECVMIGDMPADMQACKDAGIHGILMHLPQTPPLLKAQACVVGCLDYASNFYDALRIIRDHFDV